MSKTYKDSRNYKAMARKGKAGMHKGEGKRKGCCCKHKNGKDAE